ncbi:hypothetical protein [Sphingobacterium sp. UGAL515B_05]|uniref:hypothetical protein n=1 Tax=Sphingobacterium sp. UGAL515B_05 TaxID=2986767 RepID=UPI002952A036|nr:hypothetical protein [Sphingobacterium sp. UGAL515B_05]WON96179.1 hypothetical protein OK025_07130 [Sphingobacterium sp. UGAL515B_05]
MRQIIYTKAILITLGCTLLSSCLKKDLYSGSKNEDGKEVSPPDNSGNTNRYSYPFGEEKTGQEAELIIEFHSGQGIIHTPTVSIPPLKYNKSLLFMLTQDDCKQSAFSMTWAAINGKPIDRSDIKRKYYYDIEHLEADDLPPNSYTLGKTLGSTDGFGNEVRFHFTTTLAPEWDFMDAPTAVKKNFTENFFRFYMKSGLRWNNVVEMLNDGNAIAFHDLNTAAITNVDSLIKHFDRAQQITNKRLNGRNIKFLAEPNGNKSYLQAALGFPTIQTMTAQTGADKLIPYQVNYSLYQKTLARVFVNQAAEVEKLVNNAAAQDVANREAVHIGVHETDHDWAQLLLWLNNTYGKDGKDILWFPSQEEYYEYNYNRQNSLISSRIEGNKLIVKVKFPSLPDFYYPALTLNINGLHMNSIKSISSNETITSLTYGNFEKGISVNIDCRRFIQDHATQYVNRYLSKKSAANLLDAKYHINALKDSQEKKNLLNTLGIE